MLHNRTVVIAGAILAWGASLEAAISVGYYTDGVDAIGAPQNLDTGLAAPILANGFVPLQITNIKDFVAANNLKDLSKISILMIDEINVFPLPPTADLLSQATALSNWVFGGGVIAIHDRQVCRVTCTPVPNSGGVTFNPLPCLLVGGPCLQQGLNIDVETLGTLVTNGPGGIITNTTLDNGNLPNGFSDLGSVPLLTLPSGAGAVGILNNGTAGQEVGLSYRFGAGWVYYSTIPLDFYLSPDNILKFGPKPPTFAAIYAPNMVAYLGCLASGACSASAPNSAASAAPTLSAWGLGILAILLIGCATVMLRSGQAKGPAR